MIPQTIYIYLFEFTVGNMPAIFFSERGSFYDDKL